MTTVVITSLSRQRSFEQLRTEGARFGRGPLRMLWLAAPLISSSLPPASSIPTFQNPAQSANVGFVVSRKVGNAVSRNRIRRRLRAVLTDLARQNPVILLPGDYLFRVSAPIEHWSPQKLQRIVSELLSASALAGKESLSGEMS